MGRIKKTQPFYFYGSTHLLSPLNTTLPLHSPLLKLQRYLSLSFSLALFPLSLSSSLSLFITTAELGFPIANFMCCELGFLANLKEKAGELVTIEDNEAWFSKFEGKGRRIRISICCNCKDSKFEHRYVILGFSIFLQVFQFFISIRQLYDIIWMLIMLC